MPRYEAAEIRGYYDRHTPAFVALGQRGSDGAIHRAVWGPGTLGRRDAFRYVEDRIADVIARHTPSSGAPHVVDLGCGVGTSLCYLAARLPIRGTGITVSPVQVRLAADRIRAAGRADRLRCLEGDYCQVPPGVGPADVAYAIESFVHGVDPARFFAECGRLVRPGGALVVCDDFRRPTADPEAAAYVEQFRRGWHVNTLLTRDEVRSLAISGGFAHESTLDLTPYLELRRGRDRAARLLLALAARLPWTPARLDYLFGGTALQTCLARGWIGYDLVVFTRPA
jgi:SAM-dependent methyltransferase